MGCFISLQGNSNCIPGIFIGLCWPQSQVMYEAILLPEGSPLSFDTAPSPGPGWWGAAAGLSRGPVARFPAGIRPEVPTALQGCSSALADAPLSPVGCALSEHAVHLARCHHCSRSLGVRTGEEEIWRSVGLPTSLLPIQVSKGQCLLCKLVNGATGCKRV